MKDIRFDADAWKEYLHWQDTNKSILRKINTLIKEIQREPFTGIGSPEALIGELSGYYSRRIDQEHRLVYRIDDNDTMRIIACRYHYKK